jgi:hypothetical protein
MPWKIPTISTIGEWLLGSASFVLVMYKKEIQDWLKESFTRLRERFAAPSDVARIWENQTKALQNMGLDGLDTAVWVLLNEYKAQRVTVTKYEKKNGTYLATCVSQALESEMPSVLRDLQNFPVDPAIWEEVERVHHLPGRMLYVPDAQLVDIAPMRAALLNSGVWSAYYQSLPTSKGKPWAILAISWSKAHPMTDELLGHLHSSGIMCGTVLLFTERPKQD